MTFNRFISATMAVALLAACSDKDPLGEGPDNGIGNPGENIGDGYVAVQINLPTNVVSAAPRATNDNFDDGTPNEYRVSNGALLLFTAAPTDKEGDAVFKAAYDLNLESYWISKPDQTDNITTSNLVAVQVTNPAQTGEKLYGLVMVNYRNVVSIDKDNHTFNIVGKSAAFSGKFSDLVNEISDQPFYVGSGSGASNFFMTNAPLSSVDENTKPEAANVTTLVDITDGIKRTRLEAENAPAGSFFVERAVAKATLSVTANNGLNVGTGDNAVHFTADNIEWTLNATNTKSYIVRNMGDLSYIGYQSPGKPFRMVGNKKMGTTQIQPEVNLYRTYWCIDPNYDTYTEGDLTYKEDKTTTDFVKAGSGNPLYCYENTFNVDHQLHQYTTQAIVKVQFKVEGADAAATFYTINDRQDIIYTDKNEVITYPVSFILQDTRVVNAVKKAIEGTGQSVNITNENYTKYMTIKFERNDDGLYVVTNIEFKDTEFVELGGVKPEINDEDHKKLLIDVNNAYTIAEYDKGVSYYPVRFKHFAGASTTDATDLAPWDADKVGASSYDYDGYTGTKSGNAENMWLGRYGMVRNNWYDLNVTGFNKLGKPSIGGLEVDSDSTPDDNVEQWIAFKVNILSWAKRVQNVDL
ncbi:fimbria major subunit [Muribaculum intestinale]|uniref:fimbria major subunit n=1 Tax=Muribaculum intestinale TaxID=1796646 RepID=UPI003527C53F